MQPEKRKQLEKAQGKQQSTSQQQQGVALCGANAFEQWKQQQHKCRGMKQRSKQYEQAIAFIPPLFKIAAIGHIEDSDGKSLPNDTILHEKDIAYQHEKAGHRHILCLTLNKP